MPALEQSFVASTRDMPTGVLMLVLRYCLKHGVDVKSGMGHFVRYKTLSVFSFSLFLASFGIKENSEAANSSAVLTRKFGGSAGCFKVIPLFTRPA